MHKLQAFPQHGQAGRQSPMKELPWHGSSPNGWTWSAPELGTKHDPSRFNSLRAMQSVLRPGIAGASWSDPSSSRMMYNDPDKDLPDLRPHMDTANTKPGYVVMSKACGISASLSKRYTPDRPPTAVTRLKALEAREGRASAEPMDHHRPVQIVIPPRAHSTEPVQRTALPGTSTTGERVEWKPATGTQRHRPSGPSSAPNQSNGEHIEVFAPKTAPGGHMPKPAITPYRNSARSHAETISSDKVVRFDASIDVGAPTLTSIDEANAEQPTITVSRHPSLYERVQNIGRMLCLHMQTAVDAFLFLDVDGSGCLDADELCAGLHKLGIEVSHDEVEHLMGTALRNKDGKFQFKEFAEFFVGKFKPVTIDERKGKMQARNNITKFLMSFDKDSDGKLDMEELLAAFRAVDKDKDGWLSQDELQYALEHGEFGKLGEKREAIDTMIKLVMEADTNQDGRINYNEFLSMAGLGKKSKDLNRNNWNYTTSFGGAAQGFSALNAFDAKVLARLRMLEGHGEDSSGPPTPMGLVQWRKVYNQYYFGERYMSDTDKNARQIVKMRAEGKITDEKPLSYSRQKYIEFVLKKQNKEGEDPWNSTVSNGGFPVDWTTTAQRDMNVPFESRSLGKAPPLPRIDQKGVNAGIQVPGTMNPSVEREKGPFRKPCLLPGNWEPYKDVAIKASVGVIKPMNAAAAMLPPSFVTAQRHKTVKEVARETEHPEEQDIPYFLKTKHVPTVEEASEVFSRHGGRWSHHDTVGDIITQKDNPPSWESMANETRPLIHSLPPRRKKPRKVDVAKIGESSLSELSEDDDEEEAAGLPSSYGDALEFHRPPIHKDLFGKAILKDLRAPLPFMHPMRVAERAATQKKRREAEKARFHGGSERRRERAERSQLRHPTVQVPRAEAPQPAQAPAESAPPPAQAPAVAEAPKADMARLQAATEKGSKPMAQPLA